MKALAALLCCAVLLGMSRPARAQRGRPVVLLVHGRGLQGQDSAALHSQWFDALRSGASTVVPDAPIQRADVRVVWYADALDPRYFIGGERHRAGSLR